MNGIQRKKNYRPEVVSENLKSNARSNVRTTALHSMNIITSSRS